MEISASLVRELREKTGLGMMDCKKALNETSGDMEKAIDFLRKKGALKAESKSDRATSEGVVGIYLEDNGRLGAIAEVKCETDFVAKNEDFTELVKNIVLQVAKSASLENLTEQSFVNNSAVTINEMIKEKISKLGENMSVGRYSRLSTESNGVLGSYIHSNGKIGVMVELSSDSDLSGKESELSALTKDIAMHIAASKPEYTHREEVSADFIAKEKEILLAQPDVASKPENIREKMITGRLEKIYAQVCLLEQPFVKNPDQTVSQLLKEKGAGLSVNLDVKRFVRYSLGE